MNSEKDKMKPMCLAREAAIMNNYAPDDDVFIHGFFVGYYAAGIYTEHDIIKAMHYAAKIGQRRKHKPFKVAGRKVYDTAIYTEEIYEYLEKLKQ